MKKIVHSHSGLDAILELTGSSPTEKLDVVRLLTVRVKLVRLVVPPKHVYVCVSIPFYLLIYTCESIVHKRTKT